MSKRNFRLIPYLTFGGNCEEALLFYKDAIDGEIEIVNRYDNPAMNAPASYHNKILHARLLVGGEIVLYASDTFPGKPVNGHSGDISLSIVLTGDVEKAKGVYQALAEGGKAGMPFAKQFWGDWHGGLKDRYGFNWNVNLEEAG